VHSDHGTQFTSWSFGENVRRWGLLASFGTVGDCYDCENEFGRLMA
jgi:transposase InsO family protein